MNDSQDTIVAMGAAPGASQEPIEGNDAGVGRVRCRQVNRAARPTARDISDHDLWAWSCMMLWLADDGSE